MTKEKSWSKQLAAPIARAATYAISGFIAPQKDFGEYGWYDKDKSETLESVELEMRDAIAQVLEASVIAAILLAARKVSENSRKNVYSSDDDIKLQEALEKLENK